MMATSADLAQPELARQSDIETVAVFNAKMLWGEHVGVGPVTSYYDLNDHKLAVMFQFHKNGPFPQNALSAYLETDPWGATEFGYILVNARLDEEPIEAHGDGLSEGFVWQDDIENLAQKTLGTDRVTLVRAYMIDPASTWYKYASSSDTVFIKKIPPTTILSATEFEKEVYQPWKQFMRELDRKTEHTIEQETSRQLWTEMTAGTGRDKIEWYYNYIPYYDEVPFYDWHYGCTPTAAAMCLGYYDITGYKMNHERYGNFISYYFTEGDPYQDEIDHQIPDIQRILAQKMHTEKKTYIIHIPSGLEAAASQTGHGCDADGDGAGYDLNYTRTSIVNQIKKGRPCLMNTYDHTVAVVGYKRRETDWGTAVYRFFVHDTWDNNVHTWKCKDFYSMVKIDVKHPGTGDIKLVYPKGDPYYNHAGSGETFLANSIEAINWHTTNQGYGKVDIIYRDLESEILLADHVDNTGTYDVALPDLDDTKNGRIDLIWYDGQDHIIARDGTRGPINIVSNEVPAIFNLSADHHDFPGQFKIKVSERNPWAVLGFGMGPSVHGNDLSLFINPSLAYLQIKSHCPATSQSAYKNNVVVLHPRSIGFPSDQWLGVKTEAPITYTSRGYTLALSTGDKTVGVGENTIEWKKGHSVDIYNLVIDLPAFGSQDTLLFTLTPAEATDLDMGFALYTPLTTYKYDTLGTARNLGWYADQAGPGDSETLSLDSHSYSTLFTALHEDTCALVLFSGEPANEDVAFEFQISSKLFTSTYQNVCSDTVLKVVQNPTTIHFDREQLQGRDAKLGAVAFRTTPYSRWNLQALTLQSKVIGDFVFFELDTLVTSAFPYPYTNFCLFDFDRFDLMPYCRLGRLEGGGDIDVHVDVNETKMSASKEIYEWTADDLICIRELDTRQDLDGKLYHYSLELEERGTPRLNLAVLPLALQSDEHDSLTHVYSRQNMNAYSAAVNHMTGNKTVQFTDGPGRYAVLIWADSTLSTLYQLHLDIQRTTDVRHAWESCSSFELLQNYPNPFNSGTTIRYSVAHPCHVRLDIFNSAGQMINTLVDAEKPKGQHNTLFDAATLPTGVYFCRIQMDGFTSMKKIVKIK